MIRIAITAEAFESTCGTGAPMVAAARRLNKKRAAPF